MNDFTISYINNNSVFNDVRLVIKLTIQPEKDDVLKVLDAIETIDKFALKYLEQKPKSIVK